MPVNVKSFSSLGTNGSIILPSDIVAGDLIILSLGSYDTTPNIVVSGWTQGGSYTAASSYFNRNIWYWKIAVGTEAGTSIAINNASSISSHICLVLTGHASTGTIHSTQNSGADGTVVTLASKSVTANSQEFVFVSEMANGTTVPNFTAPSGFSQVTTSAHTSYYRMSSYRADSVQMANATRSAVTFTSSTQGSVIGFSVHVAEGNPPPVATSQTPSNYEPIGNVASSTNLSWTYSDQESNVQYKYEISYREAGTTGAYTTITSANGVSATSHTFAAGTFVDGKEYEWRLRLDDNQGGGWSPYYTAYFTAGNSKWFYGPQVSSTSSSSVVTTRTFANYDFESGVQGWQNNPFFGTYADCTFTNSTTRPKSGTRSMEITWPTTTGESRLASPSISGFRPGSRYLIKADIYVPSGSPNVRLDPFLQSDGIGGTVIDKDMWISAQCDFLAVNESITFAVVSSKGLTSGQKVFVDNFRIESPDIQEGGNYQIAVRTSDGVGYGPWSNPSSITVRSGPIAEYVNLNPQRVGSNINVSWNYRDVDSQAQTKYKIRYRRK